MRECIEKNSNLLRVEHHYIWLDVVDAAFCFMSPLKKKSVGCPHVQRQVLFPEICHWRKQLFPICGVTREVRSLSIHSCFVLLLRDGNWMQLDNVDASALTLVMLKSLSLWGTYCLSLMQVCSQRELVVLIDFTDQPTRIEGLRARFRGPHLCWWWGWLSFASIFLVHVIFLGFSLKSE